MQTISFPRHERGSALLIILTLIGIGAAYLLVSALNRADAQLGRDKVTAAALAQAKEALIGFAVTYGDTHPNNANGHLLLPDLGSNRNTTPGEGVTAGNFAGNGPNLSVAGRLPWRALGLAPLRDGQGNCLWYAVSGSYQDIQQTTFMNWDTLGQFNIYNADGTAGGTVSATGANVHQRPVAVIFAPGAVLASQNRTASTVDTVTECGGNYAARNYLDTFTPNPLLNNIVNYLGGTNNATGAFLFAAPKQLVAGPVADANSNPLTNDRILTITPDDLFRIIRRRSDFTAFVTSMLVTAKTNLSALPAPETINFTNPLPTWTTGGTIIGSLEVGRVPRSALPTLLLQRWQDNLLYARCTSGSGCLTVNGSNCTGVVIFAGERTGTQTRATNAQKNTWSNYLEGTVLTAFTTGATTFTGASTYSTATATDVLACISASGTHVSFANDFGSFTTAGSGVTADAAAKTVTLATATGSSGGCFWYPTALPLNGKTLRTYYDFTFTNSDPVGGGDRGNGFTLSLLRGDVGPPTACGTQNAMGVLDVSTLWGSLSYFVETDVHQDGGDSDPAGNHTAVMANGDLAHSPTNGNITAACNGSAQGCSHALADKFEESPAPLTHNQRIEIHTGYSDTTCTTAGGAYAQIKVWVDCTSCNDTTADFAAAATVSRCTSLDPALDTFYFGLTGGFRSGGNAQGAQIRNLDLRTQ